jgi:hypothetical protein
MGAQVQATLKTYEKSDSEKIVVESHWSSNGICGLIVIKAGGQTFTVAAQDMRKALSACTDI